MIAFSDRMGQEAVLLKRFLRENLYQHFQVNRMTSKARRIITELYDAFMHEPRLLPPDYQVASKEPACQQQGQARQVAVTLQDAALVDR